MRPRLRRSRLARAASPARPRRRPETAATPRGQPSSGVAGGPPPTRTPWWDESRDGRRFGRVFVRGRDARRRGGGGPPRPRSEKHRAAASSPGSEKALGRPAGAGAARRPARKPVGRNRHGGAAPKPGARAVPPRQGRRPVAVDRFRRRGAGFGGKRYGCRIHRLERLIDSCRGSDLAAALLPRASYTVAGPFQPTAAATAWLGSSEVWCSLTELFSAIDAAIFVTLRQ